MGHSLRLRTFLLLGLIAVGAQIVALANTQLPARDNIEFLRIAQSFQANGIATTLRANLHHPLYPATILAVHGSARLLGWAESVELWQRSGQLAAAIALILLPVFVYLAGLRLFAHRVAFAAAGLLCILPVCCLLGADGLSESLYLLFFFVGLWCSLEFIANPRAAWLFGAGSASGLAYLARPEGLVLPAAVLLTILVLQVFRGSRASWAQLARGSLALLAGLAVFAAPYVATTGRITGKRSLDRLFGRTAPALTAEYVAQRDRPAPPLTAIRSPNPRTTPVQPPSAIPGLDHLSFHEPAPYERMQGYREALGDFCHEFAKALRYVFGVLALLGACLPLSPRPRPCDVLVITILGIFSAAVVVATANGGYLDGRHLITVIAIVAFWSAHGAWRLIDFLSSGILSAWRARLEVFRRARPTSSRATLPWPSSIEAAIRWCVPATVFAAATIFCVVQVAVPRRSQRSGHTKAAQWIARNTPEDTVLLDTYGWVSLLGDRESYQYESIDKAFFDPRLRYVVLEASELEKETDRAASLRKLLALGGKLRARFTGAGAAGESDKTVSVYQWSPRQAAHRLAGNSEGKREMKGI